MESITWIANKVKDLRRKRYGPNIHTFKHRKRAILKSGEYNILKPKFSRRYLRYLKDTFTSLVDAEWKWTLQVLVIGFVGCWLIFALLWWLIAFVHTDLHEDHLPTRQAETGWIPCVLNINGFHSCFLYSLETQHTTGYGFRAITEECPEAIFLMCAQCIIGMIIDSFTVGVVFAKLTRPRMTTHTIQFTRNAVVCMRDGYLCMMFRVGDLRKSRLVDVSIRAIVIHSKRTIEGERITNYETQLEVQCDETGCELFMIWPVTIIHKIDEKSPFFNLSSTDMLNHKFEVVVILDGVIESTGQGTHAKSSYLENEILWGQKFENMVKYNRKTQVYEVDYKMFDKTLRVETPVESAAELALRKEQTTGDTKSEIMEENVELKNFKLRGRNRRRRSSGKVQNEPLKPYQRRKSTGMFTSNTNNRVIFDTLQNRFQPSLSFQRLSDGIENSQLVPNEESSTKKKIQLNNDTYHRMKYLTQHYLKEDYEYMSQEKERSATPPFPVDWV